MCAWGETSIETVEMQWEPASILDVSHLWIHEKTPDSPGRDNWLRSFEHFELPGLDKVAGLQAIVIDTARDIVRIKSHQPVPGLPNTICQDCDFSTKDIKDSERDVASHRETIREGGLPT